MGTASDGLGLIQLRVAIMQLRKEGKIVKFGNFGDGGVFTVIVPGLERVVDDNGKTNIRWTPEKSEPEPA